MPAENSDKDADLNFNLSKATGTLLLPEKAL